MLAGAVHAVAVPEVTKNDQAPRTWQNAFLLEGPLKSTQKEPGLSTRATLLPQSFHVLLCHAVQSVTVVEVETADEPAVDLESSQSCLIPVFCLPCNPVVLQLPDPAPELGPKAPRPWVNVSTWHVSVVNGHVLWVV